MVYGTHHRCLAVGALVHTPDGVMFCRGTGWMEMLSIGTAGSGW